MKKLSDISLSLVPAIVAGLCLVAAIVANPCQAVAAEAQTELTPQQNARLQELMRRAETAPDEATVRQLGEMWSKGARAIPLLVRLLEDKDPEVREQAARSLGGITQAMDADGEPRKAAVNVAVPALLKALKDTNERVRMRAAWALGEMPESAPQAVHPLIATYKDEDRRVRKYVVESLRKMGPAAKDAVPTLVLALGDPYESTREQAEMALVKIGAAACPPFIALLRHPDPQGREAAADMLGRIGPGAASAVPALTWALQDASASVRLSAVRTLARIGPDAGPAVPALKELASTETPEMREEIEEALKEIGPVQKESDARQVPVDAAALEQDRKAAGEYLGRVRKATERLEEARKNAQVVIRADGTVNLAGRSVSPDQVFRDARESQPHSPLPLSDQFQKRAAALQAAKEQFQTALESGAPPYTEAARRELRDATAKGRAHGLGIQLEDASKNTWAQVLPVVYFVSQIADKQFKLGDVDIILPSTELRELRVPGRDRQTKGIDRSALPLVIEGDAGVAALRNAAPEFKGGVVTIVGGREAPMNRVLAILRVLRDADVKFLLAAVTLGGKERPTAVRVERDEDVGPDMTVEEPVMENVPENSEPPGLEEVPDEAP